jgi:hypothetical protein
VFFAGLIIFISCVIFLPWYAASVAAAVIGFVLPNATVKTHLVLAASAGFASAAGAFMQDGRNYGLVSKRMGGLLMLPWPGMIFAVVFLFSFISVFLWLRGGYGLRQWFDQRAKRLLRVR